MSNMEILMLFAPQWTPVAPSIGIPLLKAQLQKAGYDVKVCDLNIEFFNDVLQEPFLRKMLKKSQELLPELSEQIEKNNYSIKNIENYPLETRSLLLKETNIKNYISHKLTSTESIISSISQSLNVFKDEKKFYNPRMLLDAQIMTKAALEIALLPYSPTKISFERYDNPLLKFNYENIKYHCLDKSSNIFLDYYPEKLKPLFKTNPEYVGIAINADSQLIPGLTLAYLIKKNYSTHVNIGGDYFRRIIDSIKKHPEIFDIFCDSIIVEDAESSVVELAQYLENKIPITEVSGLIYKDENDSVIVNKIKMPPALDDIANITLDGLDLSKYYTPEIVLPLKSNRHCSWDKCSFCDLYYGQKFNAKSPQKLISEIKEIKEKYGISHFEFIDSSIAASYFNEMSDIIQQENLDIKYFSFARLESAFSKKILEKANKSGLKMLLWGFESGSRRIVELMNKGIDFDKRIQIIKDSHNSGIWNEVFTMLGFPSETKDEAQITIDTICKNLNIMQPIVPSTFHLKKHAKIRKNPEFYGITNISEPDEDFLPHYEFKSTGMSKTEIDEMIKLYQKTYKKASRHDYPLWHSINSREHFFLYLTHYGSAWIKKNKISYSKKETNNLKNCIKNIFK